MLFNSLFGRKNSASSASSSSKNVKLNKKNHQPRHFTFEPLESRELLTVTTGSIDNETYNEIRATYPEFDLPELQSDLNVMTITPDDGALSLADLKSAIATAKRTTQPDLILVQTSASANSVTYASSADELIINVDSSLYGSVTILGWGEEKFTLDANQQSRVMGVFDSSTVNLGGLKILNGNAQGNGGGIYYSRGTLAISNSVISGNTASSGGGIYSESSSTLSISNCVVSENTSQRAGGIYASCSHITITNSEISDNTSSNSGGGIYQVRGEIIITDSVISRNSAGSGGGFFNSSSSSQQTLAMTNCKILDNKAIYSGGGFNITSNLDSSFTLSLSDSVISGNTSNDIGGGIYSSGSTINITISNSEISSNTASKSGGGISQDSSTITISNSDIIDNKSMSGNGGGIFSYGSNPELTISNSRITGNTSSDSGGGILIGGLNSELSVTNCTIASNTSSNSGGGICQFSDAAGNVFNSIIVGNTASIGNGDIYNHSGSNSSTINGYNNLSSFTDWTDGSNNIEYVSDSPLFFNASEGDYRLVPTSQAVDTGNNQYAINAGLDETSLDVNGYPRLIHSSIDIGAYELQSAVVTTLDDSVDPADGKWSLREAISNATGNITITFADDLEGEIVLTQGELVIDKPLAINGDNRITIDAAQNSRIFHVLAGTDSEPVVLNGLVIQNGSEDYGGAIRNNGTLTITNSSLLGNEAWYGGGVYNEEGSLIVSNCIVSGNIADYRNGGGIHNYYGTVTITDSVVSDNNAHRYGGGIFSSGKLTVINSDISNNSAYNRGGGIENRDACTIINSTIVNNEATIAGGGINNYSESLTITGCLISNNRVENNMVELDYLRFAGGGIYNEGAINITDSEITNNTVISYGVGYGGGIYNAEEAYIYNEEDNSYFFYPPTIIATGCIFSGNAVYNGYGGGIFNEKGALTIASSKVLDNSANMENSSGGGIYNNSNNLTIINSEISGNTADYQGGGIFQAGDIQSAESSLNITNCTISANASLFGGSGVYNLSDNLTLTNSIVCLNFSDNVSGAISASSENNLIDVYMPGFLCNPKFTPDGVLKNRDEADFHLRSDSVAIDMGKNAAVANFDKDVDNKNRIYGQTVDLGPYEFQGDRIDEPIQFPAVVDTLNDSFTLYDDEWSLREAIYCATNQTVITFADELSGTIVLTHGELNIDKAVVIDGDNRIKIDGNQKSRVIHASAGDQNAPIVLNGLQIVNGNDDFGGGVYNESGFVTITNCSIKNNTASLYGGAVVSSQGSITLSNTVISNNSASEHGGAIYQYKGTATITNSTISNNVSSKNGGGFYQNLGESTLSESVFTNNVSAENGGGIHLEQAVSTIADAVISGNTATNGGGIFINGEGAFITNSTVADNAATLNGGGMYAINSEVNINNSSIERNAAYTGDGGGIYSDQSQIYVNVSVISNNDSSENGNGGGVYSTGEFKIVNSYLVNNSAKRLGGAVCNYNKLTITSCVISGNSANKGGGVYTGFISGNESSGNSAVFTSINSTISGNSARDGGGIYSSDSNNPPSLKNSIVSVNYGANNSNIYGGLASNSRNNLINVQNPGFIFGPIFGPEGALINEDMINLQLRSDSAAIDQGSAFVIIGNDSDVDGNPRVFGDSVDIGACEYQGDRDDEPIVYSSVVNTCNDSFDPYDNEWSLREAIYFASEYVTITFAEELEEPIVLTRGPLYIDKALVIDGGGRISIESNKKSQIVYIDAGTESAPVSLANLSIKNGYAKTGAGIYQNGGYTTISDCIISDNAGTTNSAGGGIFINSGSLLANNSVITRNSADDGAGIFDLPDASLTVTNCSISYNTATVYGGGIYTCNDSRNSTTIICCTFLGNSAKESGGGLYNESTDEVYSCLIANCTFAGNTADMGGGICNENYGSMAGSIKVLNSIISYNKSRGAGAGIYTNSNVNVYETLISLNFSETEVEGVNYEGPSGDTYYTRNLYDEYVPGFVVVPEFDAKGEIANADAIDLHLRSDSVVIDWGRNYALNEIETDIEGKVRKYGRYVDLGAYEYQGDRNDQPIAYSSVVTTLNDSFNPNDNEWSLREALFYASSGAAISFDDSLHGTIILSLGPLNINKPVSIDGDGRITIDADKKSRVFYIKTGSQSAAVGLNGLTVQNGSASHGGGIYQYDSVTTVSDCTIANNYCSGDGGGYRMDNGTLLMTNCVLYGNTALSGGGLERYGGVFTIVNSTIAGNTATSYGGGIYVTASTSNSIYNTIVVNNSAKNGNNDIYLASATLSANSNISSFTGWDVNLNYTYDPYSPLFVNAEKYDLHLAPGSQALNKGNNQYAIDAGLDETATDIDGEPRYTGEKIDIGAYESAEFSVSQSDIFTGNVYFTWKQYKNTANVTLTWLAGTTRTVLGVFGPVGEYTWDTTQFANEYGVLTAEYQDENGNSLMLSTHVGMILNNDNVIVHRDNITRSETWSADKVHLLARNVSIINNATLTIAQNAVVKFWKDSYIYAASGSTLNVQKNVIFTRAEDDSVAGDTNLDGDRSRPSIGNSYTRGAGTIKMDSSAVMKYVIINVGGEITSNQTWREGNVYHVTSSITVKQNVTLTIQPGAIIKFDSGKSLTVAAGGTLKAEGSALQPIVLTSINDDEYGGDTNNDNGRVAPQAGDWKNIQVLGTAIFDHAIIRYAGNVDSYYGAIFGDNGTVVQFKNSVLEFSRYYAVSANGGTYTFINSVIREGQNSLINMHSTSCKASFINCTFADSNKLFWCGWGQTSFVNCIVSNIVEKFIGHSSSATFKNCVFWNAKNVGEQTFPGIGSNGNRWTNPLFRNSSDGDYHLKAGSPCIDAGTTSGAPTTDFTGSPRVHDPYISGNGKIDIGAYEFLERVKSSIDLTPVYLQAPESVMTGQTAQVEWTIANNGTALAKDRWTDAFYLINELTGQSILIKEYMHDGSIAAAGSQTFYTEVVIPNVTDGAWKLQVRVNSNRELFEGVSIDNNSINAESTTMVETPLLTGSQGAITSRKNNAAFYRVNVKAGDCFSMKTYSYNPVSIYMQENGVPSSSSYDYIAGQYDPNHQALYIAPSDADRVFYLLVETSAEYTGIEYEIHNEASFAVFGVSPQMFSNMGSSTLTLTGTGFKAGMSAYLQSATQTIYGTNVSVVSGSSATATFDMSGKPVGEYTLVVSLDDQTAVSSNLITVTDGVGAIVNSWLEMPSAVRVGRVYSANLYYENTGDCDAYLPIFTLTPNDDVLLGHSADSLSNESIVVLGVGADSTAGILRAGESGYRTIYFQAQETTFITSTMWDGDIGGMFESELWNSWDEYHQDLSSVVTRLALRTSKYDVTYDDAFVYLYALKTESESTGLSGYLRNAINGEPLAGVTLIASWDNGYRYDWAITDNNGKYAFHFLPNHTAVTISSDEVYGFSSTVVNIEEEDCRNYNLTAMPYSSISGTVSTDTGNSLDNLLVLAWTDSGQYGIAYTDFNGKYTITGLPLGTYHVDVESAGKFNSPTVQEVSLFSSDVCSNVDFKLANGSGYSQEPDLSSSELQNIITTFDELTFPNASNNLNVIRLTQEEYNAQNLIRAIYIAGKTTKDDIILVDSNETLTLNGTPIKINIEPERYGTVSIIGNSDQHAKIEVNQGYNATFYLTLGTLQLGAVDFLSVDTDDNWQNYSCICDVLSTTNDDFRAGEILQQYVSYYDKLGNDIESTYFNFEENDGYPYSDSDVQAMQFLSNGELTSVDPEDLILIQSLDSSSVKTSPSGHNYVIIFSGGGKASYGSANHAKYYDQICKLYSVCTDSYKIPRENIYILYADGTKSGKDKCTNAVYDKNDELDVKKSSFENSNMGFASGSSVYSATKSYLKSVCKIVKEKTKNDPDAHILVYTYDHGGYYTNSPNEHFITAWGEVIDDTDFKDIVTFDNDTWVTYVFCQCHSGGMLEHYKLSKSGKQFGMASVASNQNAKSSSSSGFSYGFIKALKDNRSTYTSSGFSITTGKLYTTTKNNNVYNSQESPNSRGNSSFPVFTRVTDSLKMPVFKTKKSSGAQVTKDSVTVVWGSVSNASGYQLILSKRSSGKIIKKTGTLSSSTTKYTFTNLEPTEYNIEIRAISANGKYSGWSRIGASTVTKSFDPNEIAGPIGYDFKQINEGTEEEPYLVIYGKNWISNNSEQENSYRILFENKSIATAAAQEIFISTALPQEMDWDTFEVDQIAIGNDIYILSDESRIADNTWLVNQASTGKQIKIRLDFDAETGEANWYMRSYVSDTYDNFPADAYDGFLPPNDENHSGEGYISYHVKYKSDLNTGDVVSTKASIIFDNNESIDTNIWFNTIDVDAPTVLLLESKVIGAGISLRWSGSDVGSGISQYQIYVSSDGNAYTLWNSFDADATSAVYNSSEAGEYSFYILAVDAAGNVGGDPSQTTPPLLVVSEMDMRIVKQTADHSSTDEISENLASITDWDDFYMEFWTTNLNELEAGKKFTATINYDPSLFVVDMDQVIVTPDGVTAEIVETPSSYGIGLSSVTVTFTVGEDGYTAPGNNTYWGAVHFTPNLAKDAGVQNVLESTAINLTANGKESGTTVKAMPFDLDHNSAVDVSDFIAFATAYGKSSDSLDPSDANYAQTYLSDFDGSGVVDVQDFIAFATNYGIKKGSAAGYYKAPAQENVVAQPVAAVNQEEFAELNRVELVEGIDSSSQPIQLDAAQQNLGAVETFVTILEHAPAVLIPAPPTQAESVQTLHQAHSSALLDLYDNQNQSVAPTALSAKAVDESLAFDDDSFDFLFDDSDSDADDNSDVDLSVVLDELDLELI